MKSHYNLFPVNPKGLEGIAEQLLKGPIDLGSGSITPVVLLENDFYKFPMDQVRDALSAKYLKFLKESGYVPNINSARELRIAKGVLKIDPAVRQAAAKANLTLGGDDGDYVVNINQPNARKLVQELGYKVPTAAIMYKLFIPYIKDQADKGDAEAQETLNEMTNTKAEWLEDLVLNKNKVRIGSKERRLVLSDKDGRFDRQDINEFGYPIAVKDSGEFYFWFPRGDERAVVRDGVAELDLGVDGAPSGVYDVLGVRCAKFF